MEPINIFIDGICIAGENLEKSGVDFPVIDIVYIFLWKTRKKEKVII